MSVLSILTLKSKTFSDTVLNNVSDVHYVNSHFETQDF